MTRDDFTRHAACRLQQRGIPLEVVELLERFGSTFRCGGAERLVFDKAARARLKIEMGGTRSMGRIERWLGIYAVLGDNGRYVTVGHRTKRLRH